MSEAVLEAGGIAPGTSPAGATTDVVTARAYRHGVLDDRVVVRLTPATLGGAEDLTMEFLGFAAAREPVPVGVGRRRALGFPAWVIVHDPVNARHALALVPDMERLARLAATRPGPARDGYAALATRLGQVAPQLLPTFWEQAGRAFVAADNPKVAGTCFGYAREAERVHALPVDEARVGDAFVEFALAGALPVKAVREYARDIAARLPPAEALAQVSAVALQRVAGGLPPHAGMAEDLSRLARAADDARHDRTLRELLRLPAVAVASMGFWTGYRTQLRDLVAADPTAATALLDILPKPPGWDVDVTADWIALLDATGAVAGLVEAAGPAPTAGRADWLGRLLRDRVRRVRATRSAALIAFVERMVPALRVDGVAVRFTREQYQLADLDVLDALLAGGVPVDVSDLASSPRSVSIDDWVTDRSPGARDLAAVAGDPRLAGLWRRSLAALLRAVHDPSAFVRSSGLGAPDLVRAWRTPGIGAGLSTYAEEIVGLALRAPTLVTVGDLITRLGRLAIPEGASLLGPGPGRIDVPAALARTLRTGLPDELAWPGLDEALGGFAATAVHTDLTWPYAVVHDGARAVVVGPDGVIREFGTPAVTGRWPAFRMIDGKPLLTEPSFRPAGAMWIDEGEPFPALVEPREWDSIVMLPVPGGGVTDGVSRWQAGDRVFPGLGRTGTGRTLPPARVASDGESWWRRLHGDGWREFDPVTSAVGRAFEPPFLRGADSGSLYPVPGPSPLGAAGGLAGWRVTVRDGVAVGEAIDGRRVEVALPAGAALIGALTLPGDATPRAVVRTNGLHRLLDPATGEAATGWVLDPGHPPLDWWHWFRPRDEAGSAALRAVTPGVAAALIEAVPPPAGVVGVKARTEAAREALRVHLPALTDDRLRRCVAAAVVEAADQARWVERYRSLAAVPAPAAPAPMNPFGAALFRVMSGLYVGDGFIHIGTMGTVNTMPDGIRAFGTPRAGGWSGSDWPVLLGTEGAMLVRAASPVFPAGQREAAGAVAAALSDAGLLGRRATMRRLLLQGHPGTAPAPGTSRTVGATTVYGVAEVSHTGFRRTRAVQVAPDGVFADVPGTERADTLPETTLDRSRVDRTVALLAERGIPRWRPAAVAALAAATGMPPAEAALILAGLPGVDTADRSFLEPAARAAIGVTVAAAGPARDRLRELSMTDRCRLLDAVIPADPAAWWDSGPDVDRVAEVWRRLFPGRVAVDDTLIAEAERSLPYFAAEVVTGLLAPAGAAWLNPSNLPERYIGPAGVALPWLAYRLPAGDPGWARLPEAYDRLLASIRHSGMTVGIGYSPHEPPPADAFAVSRYGQWFTIRVRLDRLTGPGDPVLDALAGYEGTDAIRALYSTGLADLMASIRAETATGYRQDPRVSVPSLVGEVAGHLDVSADAAAYYLQLLALPDPTDRNVARWTGAKPAGVEELAARGLVVVARRERAGRGVFLPGGWEVAGRPRLPLETWKLPLYGWRADDTPAARSIGVLRPVGELFRTAWARVAAGDVPELADW